MLACLLQKISRRNPSPLQLLHVLKEQGPPAAEATKVPYKLFGARKKRKEGIIRGICLAEQLLLNAEYKIRGELKKSGLLRLNHKFNANIRPTKTYHMPN